MPQRVGVTGASGHLGFVLCRLLIESGYAVRALCRSWSTELSDIGADIYYADVLDRDALSGFASGCDIVVHCAGVISLEGDPDGRVFRTNVEGSRNVREACVEAKCSFFVHISSVHAVLEVPLDEPYDETRPYKSHDAAAYDYSKAVSEQETLECFREGKLRGVVLRPSSILGPWDGKPSLIGRAMLDIYHRRYPALTRGGYDFIDVRDVAAAIISSFENGRNGEIYVISGTYYSLPAFAAVLERVCSVRVPRIVLPFWVMRVAIPFLVLWGRIRKTPPLFTGEMLDALKFGHPGMVNAKAVRDLGLKVRPLEETIHDFFAWNRERGMLG